MILLNPKGLFSKKKKMELERFVDCSIVRGPKYIDMQVTYSKLSYLTFVYQIPTKYRYNYSKGEEVTAGFERLNFISRVSPTLRKNKIV